LNWYIFVNNNEIIPYNSGNINNNITKTYSKYNKIIIAVKNAPAGIPLADTILSVSRNCKRKVNSMGLKIGPASCLLKLIKENYQRKIEYF